MNYYAGIDLGGTNTKIGVLDENSNLIFKSIIKTSSEEGLVNTIKRICNILLHELEVHELDKSNLKAVGVGIPGPVVNKRIVKFFANFNWEKDIDLASEFEKNLGVKTYLDNDVNVITLGEIWAGSAKNYTNVLGLAIGTGIGGGIVANGKLISGKAGAGGEVGHIKIVPNGKLCGCGQKGCFEAYASATGIIREAESRLKVNKNNLIYEITKGREIEAKDVFDAAKQNDALALDIVSDVADNLALGIANILNIIDPEIIVIGGGVALAGDFLFEKIKNNLPKYALAPVLENLVIKEAILGNDAGIYGAAYLSMLESK